VRPRLWPLALCFALSERGPAWAGDEVNPAWLAAQQLVGAQQQSGQFDFEHDFVLGGSRPGTMSGLGRLEYITREAASAYGLSSYFMHNKDPGVAHALVAVLRNFGTLSLPIAKARGQIALESTGILKVPFGRYKLLKTLNWLGALYRPTGDGRLVSYDHSYETAWGGATALSLLTELQFYHASGDTQFAPLRAGWLKGLLVLYDAGWGFRGLPDSIDENALSNGEIWLAVAYYNRLFPGDAATAAVVARTDDYMMRTYAARPTRDFYAWGVQAAAQRFDTTSDPKFSAFIAEQTRAYFRITDLSAGATENSCSETEGLAASLRVLLAAVKPDRDLIMRIQQRINSQMAKNRSLQIQPGQTRIELGNDSYLSSPSLAHYAGAFLAGTDQPYVRIDYTEHCISALLALSEVKGWRSR
jgi:hypothetical protein